MGNQQTVLDLIVCKKKYEKARLEHAQKKFLEDLPDSLKNCNSWNINTLKIFCNYMNIAQHEDFVLNRKNKMIDAILSDNSFIQESNIYIHAVDRNPRISSARDKNNKLKELRSIIEGYINDFDEDAVKSTEYIVPENFVVPSSFENMVETLVAQKSSKVNIKDYFPAIRKFVCMDLLPFKDSTDIVYDIYNAMKKDKDFKKIYPNNLDNKSFFIYKGILPFISRDFNEKLKIKHNATQKFNYAYVKNAQDICRGKIIVEEKKNPEKTNVFKKLENVETSVVRKAIKMYSPGYDANQALPCGKIKKFLNADLSDIPEKFNTNELSRFLNMSNSRNSLVSSVSRWFIPKEEHGKLKEKHNLSSNGEYTKTYLQELQKICRDRYMEAKIKDVA